MSNDNIECYARIGMMCQRHGGSISCLDCIKQERVTFLTSPWVWAGIVFTWSVIAGAIWAIFNFCAYACG